MAVALGCLLAATVAPAQADLADTVARLEPSVVTVVASHEVADGRDTYRFGSGFFVSPTDIVTTVRVLQNATAVRVVTYKDERISASVAGADLISRIAVLRIAEPLGTPVDLLTDPQTRKGEAIYTLGSHLGMGLTVTGGMVNGTDRTVTTSGLPSVNDAFQIDAPVSADASGAPVFDAEGRVRGMVLFSLIPDRGTVFRPPGEGAGGLGGALVPGGLDRDGVAGPEPATPDSALSSVVTFCLPADTIGYTATQLRETGEVRRGRLGVELEPVRADIAAFLGVDPRECAMVTSATPDGPAAKAGLRPYDVIVAMDGAPAHGVRHVVKSLQMRPGQTVPLTVRRGLEEVVLSVEVGEMVAENAAPTFVSPSDNRPIAWLGVRAIPVDAALAAHSGVNAGAAAVIQYVFPGSPAEAAGLHPGDIVLGIAAEGGLPLAVAGGPEVRLQQTVRQSRPGTTVQVRVKRLSQAEGVTLSARLSELRPEQRLALNAPAYPDTGVDF